MDTSLEKIRTHRYRGGGYELLLCRILKIFNNFVCLIKLF